MARREKILDGLAWASLSEPARIARIAAQLVRENVGSYAPKLTKSRVKEVIRDTSPPYGRGKAIFESLWGDDGTDGEIGRQLAIYQDRKERHDAWSKHQKHISKRSTRVNRAYAYAFGRPQYSPRRHWNGAWNDYDARRAFEEVEDKRDVGDQCIALIHLDDHVVALVSSENEGESWHIAVRTNGAIIRTYLRCNLSGPRTWPKNFAEAAVSLGGPKVKAALALGKKVVTDWAGRRTFIHHEGQDHHHAHVEELPWRIVIYQDRPGYGGSTVSFAVAALIHGDELTLCPDDEGIDCADLWNDYD